MSIIDFDVWVGKTLFVPPIIKICQVTRQSQYAVARLFWFITALDNLRISTSLGTKIIAGLFSLYMMFAASLQADRPMLSMLWFRMTALGFLALDILSSMASGVWEGIEIWLLVLFAVYAATIESIPPAEDKKSVRNARPGDLRR